MGGLLTAIEQSAPVGLLKTSFYVYPLINALHIASLGALITAVMLMDLRLLGQFANLPEAPLVQLFRRVALGSFFIAVTTGLLLFSVRASEYAQLPLFWIKLGLIVLAGVNFIVFSALDADRQQGEPLPAIARLSIFASLALWPCILVAGRFLGFV